jgi:hypothetical protein
MNQPSQVEKESAKQKLCQIVEEKQGLKATELAFEFVRRIHAEGCISNNVLQLIEELVKEGRLVEIEYVLSTLKYRIKSFILPGDTEVQSISAGTDSLLSDEYLAILWKSAGGDFHGPLVETGTMPQEKLRKFLRSLLTNAIANNKEGQQTTAYSDALRYQAVRNTKSARFGEYDEKYDERVDEYLAWLEKTSPDLFSQWKERANVT